MSMPLIVELQRFCEESRTVEAALSPTQLSRLLDSVADTTGGVSMQVRGSVDARGRPSLDVRITGTLRVLCQRCMRPMPVSIDVAQSLAFSDDDLASGSGGVGSGGVGSGDAGFGDAGSEGVPGGTFDLGGVEVLPMMAHIDLAELAEEEVLLSLPMLPRHADCELPGPAVAGRQSPFAVLQGRVDAGGASRSGPTEEND